MKKGFTIVAIVVVVILGSVISAKLYNKDPKTEYSSDKYLKRDNNYTLTSSSTEYDEENDFYVTHIGTFKGRKEIWPSDDYDAEKTKDMRISLSLKEGHCKVVYVNAAETTVQTVLECSEETSMEGEAEFHADLSEGEGSLKLVGYDCKDITLGLSFE